MEQIQAMLQCLLRIEQYARECTSRPVGCAQCTCGKWLSRTGDAHSDATTGKLMDAREVMDYLQISRSTFFRLKKKGLLPHRKIGSRDYFIRSNLAEALKLSIRKGRR